MDSFYQELGQELAKHPHSERELAKLKHRLCVKHGVKRPPTNIDIYTRIPEARLITKPMRSQSGVAPIAVMTKPAACPHGKCTYCPGGPGSAFGDVPQSYTGNEPSTMRAIRNAYDPYLIVMNRLEQYTLLGHSPDKVELIIQGGTFPALDKTYQESVITDCLKAMNDFSELFYPDGTLDFDTFKNYFELPADKMDGERKERIQTKLLAVKQGASNGCTTNVTLLRAASGKPESVLRGHLVMDDPRPRINTQEKGGSQDTVTRVDSSPTSARVASASSPHNHLHALQSHPEGSANQQKTGTGLLGSQTIRLQTDDPRDCSMTLAGSGSQRAVATVTKTLEREQLRNETAHIRCVGLTIETKPDWGLLEHGQHMLTLGCTRVEVGVQTIYDRVLSATNRGHTMKETYDSLATLKDLGFKICAHVMPGLPDTTYDEDLHALNAQFDDPRLRPDLLKIYPCQVAPGTPLYYKWKKGAFTPLDADTAARMISQFKERIPRYCRVQRILRDVPTKYWAGGVEFTNLRQYIHHKYKPHCQCIRCREPKGNAIDHDNVHLNTHTYESSGGTDIFISIDDQTHDYLVGFCRLRYPGTSRTPEITTNSAIIRELHVNGSATPLGHEGTIQHRGYGRRLLTHAEELAREAGKTKLVVISGIGVREYYRKLGYRREGPYMVKEL